MQLVAIAIWPFVRWKSQPRWLPAGLHDRNGPPALPDGARKGLPADRPSHAAGMKTAVPIPFATPDEGMFALEPDDIHMERKL